MVCVFKAYLITVKLGENEKMVMWYEAGMRDKIVFGDLSSSAEE